MHSVHHLTSFCMQLLLCGPLSPAHFHDMHLILQLNHSFLPQSALTISRLILVTLSCYCNLLFQKFHAFPCKKPHRWARRKHGRLDIDGPACMGMFNDIIINNMQYLDFKLDACIMIFRFSITCTYESVNV